MLSLPSKADLRRLRPLTDDEYDYANRTALSLDKSLQVCPTCGGREEEIDEETGERAFVNRLFWYRGEEVACECFGQMALYRHYLVANIPEQYMRLDWADYDGPGKEDVALYLENWNSMRINGMGVDFRAKELGVGKTFGATYIGKELVKKGSKVYFIPFVEMVSAFESDKAERLEEKMRETPVLVLDEILPAWTDKQRSLYATRLEALLRHRTNFNMPTITTTNMTDDELESEYPRTYSLLSAKQMPIDLRGADARKGRIQQENLELAVNGEIRPIT